MYFITLLCEHSNVNIGKYYFRDFPDFFGIEVRVGGVNSVQIVFGFLDVVIFRRPLRPEQQNAAVAAVMKMNETNLPT